MMRFLGRRTSVRIIGAMLVLVAAGATALTSLVAFGQAPGPGDDPSVELIPIIEVFDSAQSIISRVRFNSPTDVELLSVGVNQVPAPARIGAPPQIKVEVFDINGSLLEEFNEWHPLWVEHESADGSQETIIEESGEGRFVFQFAPDIGLVIITDIGLGHQLIEIDARQIVLDYCAVNGSDPACAAEAEPSFNLFQDPADGATGVRIDITNVTNPVTGSASSALLGGFQSQLTYDGTCVNILGVRAMDFPVITDLNIDNTSGITTFEGSDATSVPWPADLGHALTRLIGNAARQCQMDLELSSLSDVDGNLIAVPTVLSHDLMRGDARSDGNVTIADALFIAQYLVGLRDTCTNVVDTTCLHSVNAASVRHDEGFDKNTIADALFIAQYLVGLRDENYNLVQ